MKTIFQSDCENGYIDLIECDGGLFVRSGFRREARGVNIELPATEAADMAEALLRHLGEPTALSVFEAIVRDRLLQELPSEKETTDSDTSIGDETSKSKE